jgi:bis(5'-nucleosidyl)-tetraphosphatase
MNAGRRKGKVFSAGVVVVRRAGGNWYFLLLRAYRHWDFPKGMQEPGEQPLEAAIRETEEETTIKRLTFRWGHVYKDSGPYNHGKKIARYYLAETDEEVVSLPVSDELGRPEHDEYCWVQYDDAVKKVSARVKVILEWARAILDNSPVEKRH